MKIPTTIAVGITSWAMDPSSAPALGEAWLMTAWRNCCRMTESGLSMYRWNTHADSLSLTETIGTMIGVA